MDCKNTSKYEGSTFPITEKFVTALETQCYQREKLYRSILYNETEFVAKYQSYHDLLSIAIQEREKTATRKNGAIVVPGTPLYETLKLEAKKFSNARLRVAKLLLDEFKNINAAAERIMSGYVRPVSSYDHKKIFVNMMFIIEDQLQKIFRLRNRLLQGFITAYINVDETEVFIDATSRVLEEYSELIHQFAASY